MTRSTEPTRPNQPRLELHVPEPPARPGEEADFSHIKVLPAGITPRPDPAAAPDALRDMAYGLVRVLDDEARAVGPWNPQLPPELLRSMLRSMALTRAFDDRLFRAHRQGKTSFFMKSTGEEAIGAAQSMVLGPRDICFPTYRVLSWLMARGYPLIDLVNQIFSNERDPLRGLDPRHVSSLSATPERVNREGPWLLRPRGIR